MDKLDLLLEDDCLQEGLVPFTSVEDILFWAHHCQKNRYSGAFLNKSRSKKVCSIDDVFIIITRKLYSGKITKKHIINMNKYCELGYAPEINTEPKLDVDLWQDLTDILKTDFYKKGILVLDK